MAAVMPQILANTTLCDLPFLTSQTVHAMHNTFLARPCEYVYSELKVWVLASPLNG